MTMSCEIPYEIGKYIEMVKRADYPVCKDQIKLVNLIEKIFATEDIYVDTEQLKKYLSYQKYFPFDLFEWEVFLFALHNCTYRADGFLRFPDLIAILGRGAGKNGYLSFEDFCLLTPVNGVKNYDIDICANSEAQAMTSFNDIYNVLEDNAKIMSKHFYWTKTEIKNLKTNSVLRYRTSNAKTKDGGRPGKVDFDEKHQYENYDCIDVFTTGLGKKKFPRTTTVSTNGKVRGGPLDDDIAFCEQILNGEIEDNGTLPFICRLDCEEEVDDKRNWHKANPSLRYFPELQREIEKEYIKYKIDPINNLSFMVKRMNLPKGNADQEVTSWENILATNQPIPKLKGLPCVGAIDYASTQDFVSAGILFKVNGFYVWITHTWVCKKSKDLPRIKAPLTNWEKQGLITFVDDVEVSPELPAEWMAEQASLYDLRKIAIDKYRYTLLSKALQNVGFSADKETKNIILARKNDQMIVSPVISSAFANHKIIYGDNPLMRWYTNNTCVVMTRDGNVRYEKIEAKSRKTDGFMAFVSAIIIENEIPQAGELKFLPPIIL